MKFSSIICSAIASIPIFIPAGVQGHGYMYEPPARNYVASTLGLHYGSQSGVPSREYCPHCLNQNGGVCGITQDGMTNYDLWLDSAGQPMPFVSQRTYQPGQIIDVLSKLTANHAGHSELLGCPVKDGEEVTQACFDAYKFEFIADDLYDMPKDPNYPERGYFYGGQGANGYDYSMKFRVPNNLEGQKVLLQWRYITANSCSPPGYAEYFGGQNSQSKVLPDYLWTPALAECPLPYPSDGSTAGLAPEQFWNCAEVSILGDGVPAPPTLAPTSRPTRVPTIASPTPPPTDGNAAQCGNEWESCFDDHNSCCEEHECQVFEYYAQCRRKTDVAPSPPPTDAPVTSSSPPTPSPPPTDAPVTPSTPPPTPTPPPTDASVTPSTPPPTPPTTSVAPDADDAPQCRNEWDSCFDDNNSCCQDNYCEVFQWYARCRRRPDACLLEWKPCNEDASACCEGLVCKGNGWKQCQLP